MISNPASGHNRKAFDRLQQRLARYPLLEQHVTGSPAEARALIRRLAGTDTQVLAINGGDGTLACMLGLLVQHWPAERWPALIVLPGGTANMSAGDIGAAGSPRRAWRRFFRWLDRGCPLDAPAAERHIMQVEGLADGNIHYGMFLGTGAIMQATQYAHSRVHARGLGGEISLGLTLARTLWGLARRDPRFYQPTRVRLSLAGSDTAAPAAREETPMLILAASTLERLFLGIRPFWGQGDGALGLTTIRAGAAHFPRTFASILRGRPNRHASPGNGYESFRTAHFELDFDGQLNLDGELLAAGRSCGPVTVTARGPFRFLRLT
ncbi:kinase [Thiohalobacter thiocyanaticus]|uniref:Kinase n=1 Tax=Thiohalobacter thiocyanaticus TaxID=585455 RepID=A0A426QML3_9GAMM|nr:kinase [Thiohalobacter thiocyanaticus]